MTLRYRITSAKLCGSILEQWWTWCSETISICNQNLIHIEMADELRRESFVNNLQQFAFGHWIYLLEGILAWRSHQASCSAWPGLVRQSKKPRWGNATGIVLKCKNWFANRLAILIIIRSILGASVKSRKNKRTSVESHKESCRHLASIFLFLLLM